MSDTACTVDELRVFSARQHIGLYHSVLYAIARPSNKMSSDMESGT